MSAAADSFAAKEHIDAGDWDEYLVPLLLALRRRMDTLKRKAAR